MLRIVLKTSVLYLALTLTATVFVGANRLEIPAPLNEDIIGIRMPYYNERGVLKMQFDASFARKTDEDHAIFTHLIVHYLLEGNSDLFHIEVPSGILDLQNYILSGHNSIVLQGKGIRITAKSIMLKAKSRLIHLQEDVKVVINHHDLYQ